MASIDEEVQERVVGRQEVDWFRQDVKNVDVYGNR